MPHTRSPRRSAAATAAIVAVLLAVTSCTKPSPAPTPSDQTQVSSSAPKVITPQDRLAAAKAAFEAAQYIGITIANDGLPGGVAGLDKASGVGTHAPAFQGKVTVSIIPTEIDLIAVNDTVYYKVPAIGWQAIDPTQFNAPDPADLLRPGGGIAGLFDAVSNASFGSQVRSDADPTVVLDQINGTIPGAAIKALFPIAGDAEFTAVVGMTPQDDLKQIVITGPFYSGHPDVTYRIGVDLAAAAVTITPPR